MPDILERFAFSPYESQEDIGDAFERELFTTVQNLGGEAVKELVPFGIQMMEPLSGIHVDRRRAPGSTGKVTTSLNPPEEDDSTIED